MDSDPFGVRPFCLVAGRALYVSKVSGASCRTGHPVDICLTSRLGNAGQYAVEGRIAIDQQFRLIAACQFRGYKVTNRFILRIVFAARHNSRFLIFFEFRYGDIDFFLAVFTTFHHALELAATQT